MDSQRLAAWLADALPHWRDQHMGSVIELTGGWESDIFRFELTHSEGVEDLVLRRYAGDHGPAKARQEFEGMAKLHSFGYPVPRVIAAEPDPVPLGRAFMIMDWVSGDADRSWPEVVEGPALAQFVALQVGLHGLPWRAFTDDPAPSARRTIDQWGVPFGLFPDLEFADALAWLRQNVSHVSFHEPAVVHWDFHVGNVLVAPEGTTHVLDWTQIAVTDPRFDVAWTELLIAMAVSPAAASGFRREYERQRGELADMPFFETAAAAKRLFSVVASLHTGPESLGMRPEAAERMRRDLPTLAVPYATLQRHAGVTVPTVEDLLG